MENAADALKMAAAILIFIIAIASSFSLFGTAKQTADSIIGMRDKQAYLEAAELEGIQYTTSGSVKSDGTKFTTYGDRIVSIADVISTIYRYSMESYGVTIIEDGKVIARFDTSTESLIENYKNYGEEYIDTYEAGIKNSIKTTYCETPIFKEGIEGLYKIENKGNANFRYGAPWLGNSKNIQKRINVDINGGELTIEDKTYKKTEEESLINILDGKRIVEVTNEIDESKYLEDNGQETNLLQQYNMPTVEIIYIVQD